MNRFFAATAFTLSVFASGAAMAGTDMMAKDHPMAEQAAKAKCRDMAPAAMDDCSSTKATQDKGAMIPQGENTSASTRS